MANSQVLACSAHIPSADWSIQGCQFSSDLKVLPLSSYDMILGLDLLELHSPMEIHWGQKWIELQYQGGYVHLVGILPELPSGAVLQLCSTESQQSADHSAWPVEIQQLIQEHSGLFDPPTQLPPSCGCDHSISSAWSSTCFLQTISFLPNNPRWSGKVGERYAKIWNHTEKQQSILLCGVIVKKKTTRGGFASITTNSMP